MDAAFHQLSAAKDIDSCWTSKILVDIPAPKVLSNLLPQPSEFSKESLKGDTTSTTNIVCLSKAPSKEMLVVLNDLKYPPGTSFCFTGYKGSKDGSRLQSYIISKALETDGSELRVGSHNYYPTKNAWLFAYIIIIA